MKKKHQGHEKKKASKVRDLVNKEAPSEKGALSDEELGKVQGGTASYSCGESGDKCAKLTVVISKASESLTVVIMK